MKPLLLALVAALIGVAWLVISRRSAGKGGIENRSPLFEATSSESDARAAAVLPTRGSEDARHVLGTIRFDASHEETATPRDYLPEYQTEWVVSVVLSSAGLLTKAQIAEAVDTSWRKAHDGVTLFGLDRKTSRWTYVDSSDSTDVFTELKFAWPYFASWGDEPAADQTQFSIRMRAVEEIARSWKCESVRATCSPVGAAERTRELAALHQRFGNASVVVLAAPAGHRFAGRDVWDVMLCLGLRWGDMDQFHWENRTGRGHDQFFSVWTSTPPGYFLPERIANGDVHLNDLVFGFSVPRSARPLEVAEALLRASRYCQSRLGGTLLDADGTSLRPEVFLSRVREAGADLQEAGFTPGASPALHLF